MSVDALSVIRNSAASVAGQMANLLVGLVSSVYIARMLGKEQFGMYGWALGLCTIAASLANGGLDNVIVRDLARRRDKAPEYLLSAFLVKAVFSSLCYMGILAYLHLRGYSGIQLAVGYLLCSMVIAESFNASCRAVFVGMERQDIPAVVSVLTNIVRVSVVVFLVHRGYNIVAVAWVTVSVAVFMVAVQTTAVRRVSREPWRPTLATMRHLAAVGTTFLLSDIFLKVFDRADYVMLDVYKGVGAVGIYAAAYRIVEIVAMIAYSCSLALFPIMSRRAQGSKEEYARVIVRSTKYLTVFGIPLCVGVFLLSDQLMVGLYSSQFADSGRCLALLIWSRIAGFVILPGQQAVAARNAQLWLVPPVIARTILNLGLNFCLIPRYSFVGASIAMIISENLYCLLTYLVAFRGPERFGPVGLFARPLFATALMAAVVLLLRPMGIVVATAGAIVAYALALPMLGVIDSEDKRILGDLVASVAGRRT